MSSSCLLTSPKVLLPPLPLMDNGLGALPFLPLLAPPPPILRPSPFLPRYNELETHHRVLLIPPVPAELNVAAIAKATGLDGMDPVNLGEYKRLICAEIYQPCVPGVDLAVSNAAAMRRVPQAGSTDTSAVGFPEHVDVCSRGQAWRHTSTSALRPTVSVPLYKRGHAFRIPPPGMHAQNRNRSLSSVCVRVCVALHARLAACYLWVIGKHAPSMCRLVNRHAFLLPARPCHCVGGPGVRGPNCGLPSSRGKRYPCIR